MYLGKEEFSTDSSKMIVEQPVKEWIPKTIAER